MTEPLGLDDFVAASGFFQGRVTITESFISELMDLARDRARYVGRGLEHHGLKPERRSLKIAVIEPEKDGRDPVAVRQIILSDNPLGSVCFQPVRPGHQIAGHHFAILGENGVPKLGTAIEKVGGVFEKFVRIEVWL